MTDRQASLDDTDRALIAALRADSRTPVATLARRVGLSRGAVQNRINRLVEHGAILGFTVRLPPQGEPHRVRAIMSVAVEGQRSREVILALRGFPEVAAVHTTNGSARTDGPTRAVVFMLVPKGSPLTMPA